MMKYRLEKLVDDAWYVHGTYKSIERLCQASFELGKSVEKIRIIPVEAKDDA